MAKISESDRKSYNRAVIVLIIAILATAWVMFNAMEWSFGAITYIIIGLVGIFFYLNWNKIEPF